MKPTAEVKTEAPAVEVKMEGTVETSKAAVPGTPPTTETPAPADDKKTKSIVPAKYAGRYKAGGSDALAEFLNAQCGGKEGFDFAKFFHLCRHNGIAEDKVAHYETQVNEKRHGSQGRARMTLRNMLATIVRKDGKLKALDGSEVTITIAKPELSGAAAKAKEASETKAAEGAPAPASQF